MAWSLTYQDWQNKAACRGPQSLEFYPPAHGERREEKQHREQRAKTICRSCPVDTE